MDKNYIKSNKHETVRLNTFRKDLATAFLSCGTSAIEREKTAQKLCDYLCDRFKIKRVTVYIKEMKQYKQGRGTVLGNYYVGMDIIRIPNLTAVRKQPVAIKVMFDTLIHEFCHHYDVHVLKLNNSIHSAGFYKRISDLKNKLTS